MNNFYVSLSNYNPKIMFLLQPVILPLLALLPSMALSLSIDPSRHDDPFHHIANLDSRGNFVLEWTVNWVNSSVIFRTTARTTGYIGFGLTAVGIDRTFWNNTLIGGVSPTGRPYLNDIQLLAGNHQGIAQGSRQFFLQSAWENKTHTSLTFSRAFETCDPDDVKINDDTIWFRWAYAENDNLTQYHYQYRGSYKVNVLDPDYTPRKLQEARRMGQNLSASELGDIRLWTLTWRQLVPTEETTYWCSFTKAPVLQKRHHLIGFEFRYANAAQLRINHHLLVFRCRAPEGRNASQLFQPFVTNNTGEECYFLLREQEAGMPTQYCSEIVYTYVIGSRMFFLPNHTGIAFGDSPDEYFLLQVHYDNPNRTPGIVLDINIDFYYTPLLREHEAGIATVGHLVPGSPSLLLPPSSRQHSIYGHCGPSCTNETFPQDGIKVFGVQQHTHYAGVRHRLSHFRGGKELPWILNNDRFDNQYQPTRLLTQERIVLPGDHVMVTCGMDNAQGATGRATVGGFGGRQEMCVVFMYYYNKLPNFELCLSEIRNPDYNWKHLGVRNFTWSVPHLEFIVAEPGPLEGLTVSQLASDRIDWTIKRRSELQRDHREWPQINNCNRQDALAPPGTREVKYVRYPGGATEYRRRDRSDRLCHVNDSENKVWGR